MSNHIDHEDLALGLILGIAFGLWLRGTLDALFLAPHRRRVRPHGSYGSPRSTSRKPFFMEGRIIRGNGNGGPSTDKPPIKPQPNGSYQPRPQRGTPNPPPSEP
jgi:hypothetical protein